MTTRKNAPRLTVITGPRSRERRDQLRSHGKSLVIDVETLTAALGADLDSLNAARFMACRMAQTATRIAAKLTEETRIYLIHPNASASALNDYQARGWQVLRTGHPVSNTGKMS